MLSGFCLAGLECCSTVWWSAADTHLKLLDSAVSGARFLTVGVFDRVWHAHRRSVAVMCKLYKIRCKQMHPLNDALPGPYVPVRATCGALVAHRYTYAPPRCKTSEYRRSFIPLSVSLWDDLADPVFDGMGRAGRAGPMPFYWPKLLNPYYSFLYYFSFSLLSVYMVLLCGWGLRTDRVYITLSPLLREFLSLSQFPCR